MVKKKNNFKVKNVKYADFTVISLEEIKRFLKIDYDDEDNLLNELIKTATAATENFLNMILIEKITEINYPQLNGWEIKLPDYPITEIIELKVKQNVRFSKVSEDYYILSNDDNTIYLSSYYVGYEVCIKYRAGYESSELIPRPIRQAIIHQVASLYNGNDSIPNNAIILLSPFRRIFL